MYTVINSEPGLYTVGFYSPNNNWHPYEDFIDKEKAGEKCNYLNGGKIPKPVLLLRIPTEVPPDAIRSFINSKEILKMRGDYWILTVVIGDKFEVEAISVKEISQQRFQEIEATIFNHFK